MDTEDRKETPDLPKRTNQFIALTALILAICATFASLYAGANASKGILSQNKATDGWSYYQAKSLKQTVYQVQLEELELAPPENADPAKLEELKKNYRDKIARYSAEQKQISDEAKQHEADRDHFLALNKGFAGSLTYLQISILLVSLAGLMKQVYFWYAGILIGAFGVYNFAAAMMAV